MPPLRAGVLSQILFFPHISLQAVPAEFFGFLCTLPFFLVSFAPSISVLNGLPRSFGTENYLASPSTVGKRLGVLPYINLPGGVRPPTGKPTAV